MVECHQDIFKSGSLKVPKLPFRLSLRTTNSLATATRQSLPVLCLWCVLFVWYVTDLCNQSKKKLFSYFTIQKGEGGGAKDPPQPHPLMVPDSRYQFNLGRRECHLTGCLFCSPFFWLLIVALYKVM